MSEEELLLGADELEHIDLDTVEAALALLDECLPYSPPDTSSALSADPELAVLDSSEELQPDGTNVVDNSTRLDEAEEKKPRKRVREYKPAVEKMRRQRKRVERRDLERQLEQLEQQLAGMKNGARGHRGVPNGDGVTNDSLHKRLCSNAKAEELNRQLKAALSAQVDVNECIRQLLSELSKTTNKVVKEAAKSANTTEAARTVCLQELLRQSVLFSASSPHVPLARAARSMHKAARLAMDSVFCSTSALEVSKSTRVRPRDGGSGTCVEVVMTTPLNCDLQRGIKLIRDWVVAKRYRNINEVSYSSLAIRHEDQLTEARSNVNFDWPLDSTTWHCVSVSDMREEADRFVMVGTMLTAHPSGSVRFREEGWTLVTRSPVDPLHKIVVRMCYRLTTEHDALATIDGTVQKSNEWCGDPFQRHAHRRLVQRKTTKMTDLQCALLRETGQGNLGSLVDT